MYSSAVTSILLLLLLFLVLGIVIFILIVQFRLFKYSPPEKNDYGVEMITGSFGAGKTKNVMAQSIEWKLQHPNGVVIANVPYDHVDLVYNTVEDMELLLKYFSKYIDETNDDDTLKQDKYRPVLFVIDESHVYFFARNFKNNMSQDLIITLTQCRKRNILLQIITQELAQVDVMFRRLCPEVRMYKPFFFGITYCVKLYYKVSTATDVGDEYNVDEVGRSFRRPDWYYKLTKKRFRNFTSQKYLTKYVIGYTRSIRFKYTAFYNYLMSNDTNGITLDDTPNDLGDYLNGSN